MVNHSTKSLFQKELEPLGEGPATKLDEFSEKCQRGGGAIFNPKFYIEYFGPL